MTKWPVKTLGEVAVVNPSEPALSEDAPFVPMDAVTAGKRDVQYTQPRGQRSGARARAGDILFARITPCLQNGKVALVQDEITRCGGSTEFIVVRAGSEVLNGYLYQWITSDHIRDEVTALMKGATGRQRLNAEDLAQTELPVPPLEEQKRIVALLDAATARITELTACYEQARTYANNLFTSALRDALESNPDWPVKTIGEICTRTDRQDPAVSGKTEFTYIDLSAVNQVTKQIEDFRILPVDEAPGRARQLVKSGDVLVSTVRPNLNAVALVGSELNGATASTGFCVLRPNRSIVEPGILFAWVQNQVFIDELTSQAKGASYPAVTDNVVKALEIPVPSLEEQKQIVLYLDSLRSKTSEMVATYDAKLIAAKNFRQSILNSAFAGEL
jgi:restriction endonuclease S subunit